MAAYVPERGDVVWLQFDPRAGHEQAGMRPALVLSPRPYNQKAGLGLFCPITSKVKGYPFEVPLPSDLPVHGVVLSDQVKSLDWRARKARYECALNPQTLDEVVGKVLALIDPESGP